MHMWGVVGLGHPACQVVREGTEESQAYFMPGGSLVFEETGEFLGNCQKVGKNSNTKHPGLSVMRHCLIAKIDF